MLLMRAVAPPRGRMVYFLSVFCFPVYSFYELKNRKAPICRPGNFPSAHPECWGMFKGDMSLGIDENKRTVTGHALP